MIIPTYMSLKDWSATLMVDFPTDNIPMLLNEDDWKEWGSNLIQCDSFLENSAPAPTIYDNWRDWSMNVFYAMENIE